MSQGNAFIIFFSLLERSVGVFLSLCNFAPSILKVSLGNKNEFGGRKPPLFLLPAGTDDWPSGQVGG